MHELAPLEFDRLHVVPFSISTPMRRVPGLHLNFADLNGGLDVGVVGNVGQDRLRVRGEGGLEGVGRVEIEVAHPTYNAGAPGAPPAMPSSTAIRLQAGPSFCCTIGMCWLR